MRTGTERPRASAVDVLGASPNRIDARWQTHFERLAEMRERLIGRRGDLGELSTMEESLHSINPADRGTDEYDTGAQYGQFGNDQEAVFEIDEAIRRILDGTYGICQATGEPIPEERLEVIPWARYARDVEEGIERDRASRRPAHIF